MYLRQHTTAQRGEQNTGFSLFRLMSHLLKKVQFETKEVTREIKLNKKLTEMNWTEINSQEVNHINCNSSNSHRYTNCNGYQQYSYKRKDLLRPH